VLGVLVGACGKEGDKKVASQVAAKVNGDEITVHQVNNALAGVPNVSAEQADAFKRRALERLIDQHVARQQAIEKKLDRTPRVVQAIEAAKSEILARSYLEQIATAQPKPTAEEAKKYYAEHPELFAERRVFSLEEVSFPRNDIPVTAVRERAAKAKDLQELGAWLKSQKAAVAATRGVRAAEQIPMEWLPEIHKMKEGEIRVFESGERFNVVRVAARRSAPVDEATATPRIQQFLFNRRVRDAVASEVKHLREKSNIEYAGDFAKAPKEKAVAEPEPFQPDPAPPAKANFEKGIRGLR
jgi:EpsD family peptidyl-prolyl cis-trans isomerase